MKRVNQTAQILGMIGGQSRSKAKGLAARRNGKLGGRPRRYPKCKYYSAHRFRPLLLNPRYDRCPCGYRRRHPAHCQN